MIYLASPYTHEDPLVRERRYLQVMEKNAELLRKGLVVYSPIVNGHEMALKYSLPHDFSFWERFCLSMLVKADELYVLELDGWGVSKGLKGEIAFAEKMQIPITHII